MGPHVTGNFRLPARKGIYGLVMATVSTRESYFETGLEVLTALGYGGLKLAEVCSRLGVTTGSFYHYFPSWAAYTRELVEFWVQDRTVRLIEKIQQETAPRRRIELSIEVGLALPHGAEAAIRSWGSVDPHVYEVQAEVDRQRLEIMRASAMEITRDERQSHAYATWALYVLIGYEQLTLPRDPTLFEWIAVHMLDELEAGRFSGAPPL